jgi:hypothetical protein
MHTNRRLYLDAEGLVGIAHKPYRSVCAADGAALGLLMLGKKLLPNKPVALFVVIGGIAAGVTGQRLILVTAMIGRS